jgi:hypothetical protein
MSSKKQIIKFILVAVLLFFPLQAIAIDLVTCGGPNDAPCAVKDIFVVVARTTNFLVAFAGVFAVYKIIDGGFWLAISQGNDEAITTRKKQITNAIVGLALTVMAFLFVNTVVNFLLLRGLHSQEGYEECKFNLTDPLNYLYIHDDPVKHARCQELHEQLIEH